MSSALRSSVSDPSSAAAEKRPAVHAYALILVAYVALFVAVALDVTHRGFLAGADPRIARWSAARIPDWGHVLARSATHLGDTRLLAAVTLLVAAWLLYRRQRLAAGLLVASAATTGILTFLLKDAFRRPRPMFLDAAGPHSFSFPSGHASGAFAVYVLAALLLTAELTSPWRRWTVCAALGLATLVATTRVLMPVHYLTDVIAGGAGGLSVVAGALLVQAVVVRRR